MSDNSNPEKTDTSEVIVSISRNLQSPRFTNDVPPYAASINYNQAPNVDIFTTTAIDPDMTPSVICNVMSSPFFYIYFG